MTVEMRILITNYCTAKSKYSISTKHAANQETQSSHLHPRRTHARVTNWMTLLLTGFIATPEISLELLLAANYLDV